MTGIIVLLSISLAISLIVSLCINTNYKRLKYICLTNGKVTYFDSKDYGFRIRVHSENGPWEGGIGHVHKVFSSPAVYAAKITVGHRIEQELAEPTELVKSEEYQPGSWKESK